MADEANANATPQFTPQELAAFVKVCDLATRGSGLEAAEMALPLARKATFIMQAMQRAEAAKKAAPPIPPTPPSNGSGAQAADDPKPAAA